MRQTTTAEVRADGGKATSSGAARPRCSPANGSATIKFRCVDAPIRRKSHPTAQESGECR